MDINEAMNKHAVLVHLKLSNEEFGTEKERDRIRQLCDELERTIESKGVGEFDGDEFGGGECTLFMYGPDADALFQAVEPILRRSPLAKGACAIKRYGPAIEPDAREVRIDF